MTTDDRTSSPLARLLRERIRREGPLSFAVVMESALYDPEHGYYREGPRRLGVDGDFITAADSGSGLGRCIAEQLVDFDRQQSTFEPFDLLEVGAGRGTLARDVIAHLPEDLSQRLSCTLVDRSAGMRAEAKRQTPTANVIDPAQLQGSLRGAWVAVELFDALPVHRVVRRGTRLMERRVDADLQFVDMPPTAEVEAWAEQYGAAPRDGMQAEVNLGMAETFDGIDRVFAEGLAIIIDYGDEAEPLYTTRPHGTLLAYHRHRTSNDLLARIGEQDLTAHVNFTALIDHARKRGWHCLGLTSQERFLIGNGILAAFEATDIEESRDPQKVRERRRVMQLIHPEGMGHAFRVLLLCKGQPPPLTLRGLRPFLLS